MNRNSQNNNNRRNRVNRNRNRSSRRLPINSGAIPNQIYADTFPREMKVTLNYCETRNFTTTGSVANNDYLWNLNSIFDPNRTGTGHQPLAHDQWALLYNRYRVDEATVTFEALGPITGAGVTFAMLANNEAANIGDITTVVESPLVAWKIHAPGGPPIKIKKRFNLAVVTGVTRAVYNADDRYSAVFGNSPSELLILHTSVAELNYQPAAISYVVRIEYKVTMFDPFQSAPS